MKRILQGRNNFMAKGLFALLPLVLFGALFCSCAPEPEENLDSEKPMPSLVGTRWLYPVWGDQFLYFKTEDTVEYTLDYPPDPALNEVVEYHYVYDKNKKIGRIDERGDFVITWDNQTLHIPDYYIYHHAVDFARIKQALKNEGSDSSEGNNL
jgi:hypothetical protein